MSFFLNRVPQSPGKRRGRRAAALLLVVIVATAIAAVSLGPSGTEAQGPPLLGISVVQGTVASEAGGCAEVVEPGDEFAADIIVTNVDNLVQFELRFVYDPSVISLESADYDFMLLESGGALQFPQFLVERPGQMFLSATETKNPDSGTGILARLHLKALRNGSSPLEIKTAPKYYGPRLTAAFDIPVGDMDGDGIWDDTVVGASVEVGADCPPPTPKPSNPTPRPDGSTPEPAPDSDNDGSGSFDGGSDGSGSSSASGGSGGSGGSGSGPLVIEPGQGGSDADGDGPGSEDDADGDDPSEDGASSDDDSSGDDPGVAGGAVAGESSPGGDGGGTLNAFVIAWIVAPIFAAGGGGLLLLMRRLPWT